MTKQDEIEVTKEMGIAFWNAWHNTSVHKAPTDAYRAMWAVSPQAKRLAELEAENARLRDALAPFAIKYGFDVAKNTALTANVWA